MKIGGILLMATLVGISGCKHRDAYKVVSFETFADKDAEGGVGCRIVIESETKRVYATKREPCPAMDVGENAQTFGGIVYTGSQIEPKSHAFTIDKGETK